MSFFAPVGNMLGFGQQVEHSVHEMACESVWCPLDCRLDKCPQSYCTSILKLGYPSGAFARAYTPMVHSLKEVQPVLARISSIASRVIMPSNAP